MADAFEESFKQFANKQDEILRQLADSHSERLLDTLKNLEDEIIAELQQAVKGSLTLDTAIAIKLRPRLKSLIEQNFLQEADRIIREDYDKLIKEKLDVIRASPIRLPDRFKTLTQSDLQVLTQLKQLSFSGFEDVANRFLTSISDEIYQSAVTGKPFKDIVKNIRGQINGVYQRSNETAINRLVDYIAKNRYSSSAEIIAKVKSAREILHTKYASDILGNNMRKYADQIAHDSIMQFDAQFTKYQGDEAGLRQYRYSGTLITTTRQFCADILLGERIMTEERAREIWANRSWSGKSGTDPFINRGGYRCRHTFIPYDEEWENEFEKEFA